MRLSEREVIAANVVFNCFNWAYPDKLTNTRNKKVAKLVVNFTLLIDKVN